MDGGILLQHLFMHSLWQFLFENCIILGSAVKVNSVGGCNYHPKTHLPQPIPFPSSSPHAAATAAAPTPFLKAAALKYIVVYLQMNLYHLDVMQPIRKLYRMKQEVGENN